MHFRHTPQIVATCIKYGRVKGVGFVMIVVWVCFVLDFGGILFLL